MIRFQASGPRVGYTPKEQQTPFKQLVGLYNTWQSLSPETRKRIADLFSSKDTEVEVEEPSTEAVELTMAGIDPNLFNAVNSENAVKGTAWGNTPYVEFQSPTGEFTKTYNMDNPLGQLAKGWEGLL